MTMKAMIEDIRSMATLLQDHGEASAGSDLIKYCEELHRIRSVIEAGLVRFREEDLMTPPSTPEG